MWKLISVIVAIVFFAIFFIQNMVKVPIRFVVTEPIDIRLTYLLLTTFVLGYLFCTVLNLARGAKKYDNKVAFEQEEEEDEDF